MGRLTDERPRLQTGPGKFGRPALSGGLRKRSPGGNEIPTRNRKSGLGNPSPTAGASEFYPNQNARNRDSECNALFYKRGCQEHSSPSAGGAVMVRGIQSLQI